MAKIIDVRSSGGQCVILGDSLTIPNFTSGYGPQNVLNGSVRFNAQTGNLELYSSINGGSAVWHSVAVNGSATSSADTSGSGTVTSGSYLPITGGTVNGNVTVTGVMTATTFAGAAAGVSHADLAERYHADKPYDQGTLLVIGGIHEVTISTVVGDPTVAGIVSTRPGLMLNMDAGTDATHPYVALRGRVPCKVSGRVRKGESLMSSSIPGHATVAPKWANPLSIIGRALEDFDGALGVIEVKV